MLMGSCDSSVNYNKNVSVIMYKVLVYCKYILNSSLHKMFRLLLCGLLSPLSTKKNHRRSLKLSFVALLSLLFKPVELEPSFRSHSALGKQKLISLFLSGYTCVQLGKWLVLVFCTAAEATHTASCSSSRNDIKSGFALLSKGCDGAKPV